MRIPECRSERVKVEAVHCAPFWVISLDVTDVSIDRHAQLSFFLFPNFIHHSFSLSLQAQNLPFQQILPTLDFFLPTGLPHDNGTGPDLLCSSFFLFLVSHSNFLFVPCGRLSWLPVCFLLHVKYPTIVSYRIVCTRDMAVWAGVRLSVCHTLAGIYPDPSEGYNPPCFYATPLTSIQQRRVIRGDVNQDHTIKLIDKRLQWINTQYQWLWRICDE